MRPTYSHMWGGTASSGLDLQPSGIFFFFCMYVPRATPLALWQTFLAIDSKNIPSVRVVFGYGLGGVWRPFPQMGSYRFPLATPDLGPFAIKVTGASVAIAGCRDRVVASRARCPVVSVSVSNGLCAGGAGMFALAAPDWWWWLQRVLYLAPNLPPFFCQPPSTMVGGWGSL